MTVSAKVLRVPYNMLSDFYDFLNSHTPRNRLVEFVNLFICSEIESNIHRLKESQNREAGLQLLLPDCLSSCGGQREWPI